MELQMMVVIGKSNIKASCKLHLFFSHNAISFHESFSHDVLLGLVKKIKQTCVLLFLEKCHSIIISFDF